MRFSRTSHTCKKMKWRKRYHCGHCRVVSATAVIATAVIATAVIATAVIATAVIATAAIATAVTVVIATVVSATAVIAEHSWGSGGYFESPRGARAKPHKLPKSFIPENGLKIHTFPVCCSTKT